MVQARDVALEQEFLEAADAVFRFAHPLTRDPAQAEDLAQETFLRAWARRGQYQPGTNCRAWLFTICRRLFVDRGTRAQREVIVDHAGLEALAAAGQCAAVQDNDPVGAVFASTELDDAVARALDRLPEEQRLVVSLVDIEDQSYASAADVLGVPVGTVRSRLFRGRRLLQCELLAFAQDAGLLARPKESS